MHVNLLNSFCLQLGTTALAPILLAQGRRVRRRMPMLPEPPGERAGSLGNGPMLRVLILGDSAAAGVGVATQSEALAGQLAQRLAAQHSLNWRLLARTGFRADDGLRLLRATPDLHCDVALTSLGVNNATALTSPRRFGNTMQQVIGHLRDRCGARLVLLSGLPPMGRFPALPQPLRWRLACQARLLDDELRRLSRDNSDCQHLPFDPLADGSHMASDGFHPGKKAYRGWADAAASRIAAWQPCADLAQGG